MPRNLTITLLASLTALLGGCVGTKPERIHVRRTPEEIARTERGPGSYAELQEQLKQEDEARALDGSLARSEAWLKVSKLRIAEIAKSPNDPWESYEDERRAVLYRHWGDKHTPPPVFEGEPLPGEPAPARGPDADGEGEGEGDEPKADDTNDYGY